MLRFRLPRPVALVGLLLATAVVASGCSRALMAPDGRSIYWNAGTTTPERYTIADRTTATLPTVAGGSNLRAGMLAPDGRTGYVITANGVLHRLAGPDGVEVGTGLPTSLGNIVGVPMATIAPDGASAILGSPTGDLLMRIDLAAFAETATRSIGNGFSISETAAFTPDGSHLIAAQFDGTSQSYLTRVRASDLALAVGPVAIDGAGGGVAGVVLSPDGTVGYAVGDTAVVRFDPATLQSTGTIPYAGPFAIQAGTLMRSPDGERLYLLDGTNPQLRTFDLVSMRELPIRATPSLTTLDNWGVLSPDGRTVYVGNDNGFGEQLEVATAKTLALAVSGPGAVRVSSASDACRASCAYEVLDYRTITLTAVPEAGASFTGWGGACAGAATTCTLPMSEARSASAGFAAPRTSPDSRIRGLRTTVRIGASGIFFTTTLRVPGPGRLVQTVALPTETRRAARSRVLCRTTAQPTTAGTVTLRCETGPRTRAALTRGRLSFAITTAFSPTDGTASVTRRTATLPRTPLPAAPPVTG